MNKQDILNEVDKIINDVDNLYKSIPDACDDIIIMLIDNGYEINRSISKLELLYNECDIKQVVKDMLEDKINDR